ncbi:protein retinal degeneration B isoform X1 [Uranotaenia lowii]|uniref:protein retinal degeneration B isoform X1 n=1 Tax=Uranotaenia lowii TaxID=190385 RepID=UPI00247B1BD4|nr:protein retinal degeneration B isoform X1 [Uranotaenia lowii]XP_055586783.1 protein retinal degeneration B isoform X1 [Uranotaenia lowii]XP_055586784.1 protein retinal degeneration B isoform X1 [Uranotaenia lowii]XP_055586785.1 protein retinal degeneration B isoform X1 [Uranotaenia lowii]XP_055586786.1 protein retinal degeneration B isoform X1 [Uranotaenia lowii]
MLIKEYRIPLPLTVDEYRIAQLYMIAKKSREESKGAGSGVEIIVNEPYQDGPGGNGQYTRKIYHVGSHLPGWIKGLLPKSALTVEEEAWNAYPYTKTRYTCPFVEKFSLEIETYYFGDNGHQENVFKLNGSDLRNRIVDTIDIVKDQLTGADYTQAEDPTMYVSEKTNRGPLGEDWLAEYWEEVKGKSQPTARNMSLMCAYKLCRVEFRYWGMQTKLEKFIHDVALRKTMVRAHRQAWAWQDEWFGLTMDDIREIERQTQLALQKKMGIEGEGEEDDDRSNSESNSRRSNQFNSIEKTEENSTPQVMKKPTIAPPSPPSSHKNLAQPILQPPPKVKKHPPVPKSDSSEEESSEEEDDANFHSQRSNHLTSSSNKLPHLAGSKGQLPSPLGSAHSFDLQIANHKVLKKNVANWRMEKLEVDSKSGSEEEFFDCLGDLGEQASLAKWSSLELLAEEDDSPPIVSAKNQEDSIFSHSYLQRVASERGSRRPTLGASSSMDRGNGTESPPGSPSHASCPTTVLVLVMHSGSVLDASSDMTAKKSDVTTFRGAFESVMRQHYPSLVGHVVIRLVPCPSVCTDALGILSSLSPYSFDASPSTADIPNLTDIPIGAIPLLTTCSPDFQDSVNRAVASANLVYAEFLKTEEGKGFSGQVALIGDSMGSVLVHDALCRNNARHGSEASGLDHIVDFMEVNDLDANKLLTAPSPRRRSSSTSDSRLPKFDFEVGDFFMFGSPLAVVLAARRLSDSRYGANKPSCMQIYNLFHPTDPTASRLEPLLSARFSMLAPVNVPRYAKYPLGNGQPYHLLELIQSSPQIFSDGPPPRRLSDASIQSTVSGMIDNVPLTTINQLQQRWWGSKRLDYALYCPDGLSNFPAHALPHLFHASYWESSDVIAFILRQIGRFDNLTLVGSDDKEISSFRPAQPREKWNKKRTSVKLKNVTANHRANDVIVREGEPQKMVARFMYGPLDMITLAGEKVDIHVMKDPPGGEWIQVATETTDKNGRVSYVIPDERSLGYGIYPVKMVVRGDHTSVDFYLAVVPPKTECVVFSIDGSFTASVSVTGKDPKVRAGAVDVCRHWQELGYLLIYITGRPDMQQQRVLSWLSQHNFPHGLVSFADGLSTDPLGHKAAYLNNLIQNHGLVVHLAYGSSKDISVYTNIGLKPKQIFIVGKVSKKHQSMATPLTEGYAAHLSSLMAPGGSRPAQGNARMVIPRGCFNLPGQNQSIRRRSNETGVAVTSSPVRSGFLKRKTYLH